MSNKTDKTEGQVVSKSQGMAFSMLWSIADTTWRMFTPAAIFVSAGLVGDIRFHTRPWLTIVGAIAGLGMAIMLVRSQLRGGL
jgi:F0F1-type ATP synthase assembly protein I